MDRSPSPGRRVAQLKPEDSVNDPDFETRKDVVALSAVLLVFLLPLGLHHLESGHQIAEEFELQVLVPFPFEDQLFVVLHPGCDPQLFFKALEDVPLTSAGRAVGSADCLVAVAGPAVGDAVLVLMESEPIAFGTLDLFRGGVPFTSLADYSAHDGGGFDCALFGLLGREYEVDSDLQKVGQFPRRLLFLACAFLECVVVFRVLSLKVLPRLPFLVLVPFPLFELLLRLTEELREEILHRLGPFLLAFLPLALPVALIAVEHGVVSVGIADLRLPERRSSLLRLFHHVLVGSSSRKSYALSSWKELLEEDPLCVSGWYCLALE